MGVPKGTKNPCNCVQVQAKPTAKSEDYWPQVSYFILAHGWRLVWVQGVLPLQMVMNLFQCPRRGGERAKESAVDCHLHKNHGIFFSLFPPGLQSILHTLPPSFYTRQRPISPKISNHQECSIGLGMLAEEVTAYVIYFYPAQEL